MQLKLHKLLPNICCESVHNIQRALVQSIHFPMEKSLSTRRTAASKGHGSKPGRLCRVFLLYKHISLALLSLCRTKIHGKIDPVQIPGSCCKELSPAYLTCAVKVAAAPKEAAGAGGEQSCQLQLLPHSKSLQQLRTLWIWKNNLITLLVWFSQSLLLHSFVRFSFTAWKKDA